MQAAIAAADAAVQRIYMQPASDLLAADRNSDAEFVLAMDRLANEDAARQEAARLADENLRQRLERMDEATRQGSQ